MRESRLRVGVLFGGRSCEHEVSVRSARSVLSAMDRERYEPVPVGVSRSGRWRLVDEAALPRLAAVEDRDGSEVPLPPPAGGAPLAVSAGNRRLEAAAPSLAALDVVFPLIHGPLGEDGTVQGLLELAGIPYVGCGVLGSAVGMDKGVMKALLRDAGLPVCAHRVFSRNEWHTRASGVRRVCEAALGYPLFVKPANLGSSVGVSKVCDAAALAPALDEAARYDRRIVVEAAVDAPREIEVAVLGNDTPAASVPGEVIPAAEFYDYRAKYAGAGARLVVPADLPARQAERVRRDALRAFRVLDCAGLARVDFLLARDGALFVNEVNTLPGFTETSMFPRLWAASGLDYPALIARLVELALERHAERQDNRTRFACDA